MSRRHLPPYERSDRSHGGHGSMNKPWLDEQASEEQARQGSSTGVLMQQAGEPSDQLAVSARQTNENVAPKRAQAKQTSERKNSTSERNIRTATRHRQKFVRHRVHRHA